MCRIAGLALLPAVLAGCGTTRSTDTKRAATEQLIISQAIDQAVGKIDFSHLAGQDVHLETRYLSEVVDKDYLISSLRQQLLANGCRLRDRVEQATYVVEARSGAVGTDRFDLVFGIPQMTIPAVIPGYPLPASIPEIAVARNTDQYGVAKIAVYAYNRETGQAAWQSGIVNGASNAKDSWVLGAGPFRRGSMQGGEKVKLAGRDLPEIPLVPLPLPVPDLIGQSPEEPKPDELTTDPFIWQPLGDGPPVRIPARPPAHEPPAEPKPMTLEPPASEPPGGGG